MKAGDDLVFPNIQAHLVPATLRGHRQLHWIGGVADGETMASISRMEVLKTARSG